MIDAKGLRYIVIHSIKLCISLVMKLISMTNNSQQRIMNNENLLLIIIEMAYIIVHTMPSLWNEPVVQINRLTYPWMDIAWAKGTCQNIVWTIIIHEMLCKMAAYTVLIYIYNKKKTGLLYKTRRDYRWITNLLTQSGGTQKHLFTGPFLLLYYYTPYMLCV